MHLSYLDQSLIIGKNHSTQPSQPLPLFPTILKLGRIRPTMICIEASLNRPRVYRFHPPYIRIKGRLSRTSIGGEIPTGTANFTFIGRRIRGRKRGFYLASRIPAGAWKTKILWTASRGGKERKKDTRDNCARGWGEEGIRVRGARIHGLDAGATAGETSCNGFRGINR